MAAFYPDSQETQEWLRLLREADKTFLGMSARYKQMCQARHGLRELPKEMLSAPKQQLARLKQVRSRLNRLISGEKAGQPIQCLNNIVRILRDTYSLAPHSTEILRLLEHSIQLLNPEVFRVLCADVHEKVVILHLSCQDRIDLARSSVRSFHPYSDNEHHLIVVGRPFTHDHPRHSFYFDYSENTIYLDVLDNYESLQTKLLLAYTIIHIAGSPRLVFKCDDDIHALNKYKFENLIAHLIQERTDYAGKKNSIKDPFLAMRSWHVGKCTTPYLNNYGFQLFTPRAYADGGAGYFLSALSLSIIARFFHAMRHLFDPGLGLGLEDMIVGLILEQNGVDLHDIDLLGWSTQPNYDLICLKSTADHEYINPRTGYNSATGRMGWREEARIYQRRIASLQQKSKNNS